MNYDSLDELLDRYNAHLQEQVDVIYEERLLSLFADDSFRYQKQYPCTVVSLFEHDCIEKGLSYREGGTGYTVISPHIGGLPDVVNSLYAMKKVVFEEKILSFREFMEILKNNWNDREDLRRRILREYSYYGNDNDEVDLIAADILNSFSDMCKKYDGDTPVRFVSGVSTFGRQVDWAPARMASAFGKKAGEVLAGNLSPTPGTDHNGANAIIKSYCKADLRKQYTGAALDIGFVPSNLETDNAVIAICGLIKGFLLLGGFFMQMDTVDAKTLLDAQKNPGDYPELSVRVSGWNARFVTMSKEWQDLVIERTMGK